MGTFKEFVLFWSTWSQSRTYSPYAKVDVYFWNLFPIHNLQSKFTALECGYFCSLTAAVVAGSDAVVVLWCENEGENGIE